MTGGDPPGNSAVCGGDPRRLADVPRTDLEALLARHDALLLDAFGVLITGVGAVPGAAAALERIRASGTPFVVLTNDASRLPETCSRRYAALGLPDVEPDQVVTAGSLLRRHMRAAGLVGSRCMVLGTADSRAYVERAGGTVVGLDPEADVDAVVVCDEDGYPLLQGLNAAVTAALRRLDAGGPLALLLPNPDLLFPTAHGRYGVTAGAVAAAIEAALRHRTGARGDLAFTPLGKPHRPIVEEALERLGHPRDPVLVGDQLGTDILCANRAGIASVLVASGLTPDDDRLPLTTAVPDGRMGSLGDG